LDDVLEITLGAGPSHPSQSGEARALPARRSRMELDMSHVILAFRPLLSLLLSLLA
jgi:hypothetical protein